MWDRSTGDARTARLPRDWHKVRARVLARDQHVCQWPDADTVCGAPASHVDHIEYGTSGPVPDHELWALCPPHHRHKTASEGGRARAAALRSIKRAPLPHPGLRW